MVDAVAPLSSFDVELVDRFGGLAGADTCLLWPGNSSNVHQEVPESGVRLADDMLQSKKTIDTTFVTFEPLLSMLVGKTHARARSEGVTE